MHTVPQSKEKHVFIVLICKYLNMPNAFVLTNNMFKPICKYKIQYAICKYIMQYAMYNMPIQDNNTLNFSVHVSHMSLRIPHLLTELSKNVDVIYVYMYIR